MGSARDEYQVVRDTGQTYDNNVLNAPTRNQKKTEYLPNQHPRSSFDRPTRNVFSTGVFSLLEAPPELT